MNGGVFSPWKPKNFSSNHIRGKSTSTLAFIPKTETGYEMFHKSFVHIGNRKGTNAQSFKYLKIISQQYNILLGTVIWSQFLDNKNEGNFFRLINWPSHRARSWWKETDNQFSWAQSERSSIHMQYSSPFSWNRPQTDPSINQFRVNFSQ